LLLTEGAVKNEKADTEVPSVDASTDSTGFTRKEKLDEVVLDPLTSTSFVVSAGFERNEKPDTAAPSATPSLVVSTGFERNEKPDEGSVLLLLVSPVSVFKKEKPEDAVSIF
jgi:hypothetical protein